MYEKQWDFLKNKHESGKLAHAYVFSGYGEAEKKAFAKEFVKLLHCESASKDSCGTCYHCTQIEKEAHPDMIVVSSATSPASVKAKQDTFEIHVEQIRDVNEFLSYKPYYGKYKTVIVDNAERMTRDAQDCFLKNLEEPKGSTLIMFLSSKPDTLLPTITSRCQAIMLVDNKITQVPALSHPVLNVLAYDLAEKFKFAKAVDLEGDNLSKMLQSLQMYFRGLLLSKLGIEKAKAAVQKEYSIPKITKILTLIERINYQISTSNANPRLALEIVLMEV